MRCLNVLMVGNSREMDERKDKVGVGRELVQR